MKKRNPWASHGSDQEDNSEWFRSSDPKAIKKMYGDLNKTVGQTADVGDLDRCKQEVNSHLEGDDA